MTAAELPPLVVGFDLDMTLLDTRPVIGAVYHLLAAETGTHIDVDTVVGRLGPPLADELANWFPADQVPAVVDRYREIYHEHIGAQQVLPGVVDSLAAVRAQHGSAVVITAKHPDGARRHLDAAGFEVAELVGSAWADGKSAALVERSATVYVGDHTADMAAGRAAGVYSVGVTTGGCTAEELTAAGADVVLPDLTGFPAVLDDVLRERRLAALRARLAELGSLVVAFSGGADSAFLLAEAVRVLGTENVVAATAISPSLPAAELAAAREFAAGLGVRHLTPGTHEMRREGYRANAGDRCYFCKAELLDTVGPLAAELGIEHVATGTNADDAVAGFRPGIRAAFERGAVTPLRDAGLTKSQIRYASRELGLATWDKPAAACLSSRIAYGIQISPAKLRRVERAETTLRAALVGAGIPVQNLRVRDLGEDGARVEVDADLVAAVRDRSDLLAELTDFDTVTVDPRGFRSGAMNELLPNPEVFR
ncbi:ATP-dependent sacrificial sulfur transferase LarE [Actinocatenispora sera]|uniref:ATP-dependent sacrificial sulfur transferase LarE n=1 Tax=Actinocatenispora sera TaxID=390989 RepID=UPI00340A7D77